MKIWMKNFFYTTGIISLVSLVTLLTLYLWMPSYYENKLKKEATSKTEELISSFEKKSFDEIKHIIDSSLDFNYAYKLLDKNGNLLSESFPNTSTFFIFDDQKNTEELTKEPSSKELITTFPGLIIQRKSFKDKEGTEYTLVTEIYSQPISDAKRVLLDLAPYIIGISLLLGMIAALIYSKLSTKRIRLVSENTRKMVDFEQDVTCHISGKDEISDLANDITHLNDTLKEAIHSLEKEVDKRKEAEKNKAYFVQSAAHELKTPVAIMSGLVEGMSLNIGKYQDHETYLKKCQELLNQQTKLISEITSVYKLTESVNKKKSLEKVNLNDLISPLIEANKLLPNQGKKDFLLNISEDSVLVNPEDLTRILSNVINNAYRYSFDQSQIKITYQQKMITIENNCIPLEEDILMKIFDPFYRPDFARNRNDGGSGLGLFFVKQLADFYQYEISFTPNRENTGMVFKINL